MSTNASPQRRISTPRVADEQLSRRSACDRCRAHKLRCERGPGSSALQPCCRCLKARVKCTTGNSLRPGRPSQAFKTAGERERQRETQSTMVFQSEQQQENGSRSGQHSPPTDWDDLLRTDLMQTSTGTTGAPLQATALAPGVSCSPSDFTLINTFSYNGVSHDSANSGSDIFDLNTAFDVSNTGHSLDHGMDMHGMDMHGLGAYEHNIPADTAFTQNENGGHDVSNTNQIDMFMEFTTDAQQPLIVSGPVFSEENRIEDFESTTPPTDLKEECLGKLSDLHSSLMRDLNLVRSIKRANDCIGGSSIPQPPIQNRTRDDTEDFNFPIGRMLRSSEKFLDILKYFVDSFPDRPTSPTLRSRSDSRHSDRRDRNAMSHSTSSRPSSHQSQPSPDFSGSTSTPTGLVRFDVPTRFSILSCYVCLLRIYRTIFSCIHDSLIAARAARVELPPLFPGLHLGGFQLDAHPNLQVQMLVHISGNMLSQIDEALGLPDERGRHDGGRRGILEQTTSTNLLLMMMKEEAAEGQQGHEDGSGGVKSLREIMKNITRLC